MKDLNGKLDWNAENASSSLQEVFDYVMSVVDEAIKWYFKSKKLKKYCAQCIRVLSLLLGAVAALLPTIGELMAKSGRPSIGAGWTVVLGGTAATLLLLDKFFGYSTGWMRYITAELQLRQMKEEFQIEWETSMASWVGKAPDKDQILQMMDRCRKFVTRVNNLVRNETNAWIREFESAIRQTEKAAQARPADSEPGV